MIRWLYAVMSMEHGMIFAKELWLKVRKAFPILSMDAIETNALF